MKDFIQLGDFLIPKDYFEYDEIQKLEFCDNILDQVFLYIDKRLHPKINRMVFMKEILEHSLQTNIKDEYYEVSVLIFLS